MLYPGSEAIGDHHLVYTDQDGSGARLATKYTSDAVKCELFFRLIISLPDVQ